MTERGSRKVRQGVVVGDKAQKTVTVSVQRIELHPRYGRIVRRKRKYMAHDEENQCHIGDTVIIMETRPLSKNKRWRVKEVIEKAK
ncbi:MAG: 30S ribosomal protein S17 [Chitinispirillaceae bacterium]